MFFKKCIPFTNVLGIWIGIILLTRVYIVTAHKTIYEWYNVIKPVNKGRDPSSLLPTAKTATTFSLPGYHQTF